SPGAAVLPLLRFVGAHGNASVFRWRTGLEPRRVERPPPPEAPEPPREDTVRPGGTAGDSGGGTGVFGCWAGVFGCQTGVSVCPHHVGRYRAGFGVPPHPPVPAAPEGVARGSDALTVLENAETRNQFIDELMELELFLAQRLLELEDEADVVAMSQLQLAPAVLQGQSSERVRAQLATTRELLAQLCSRSVQHLCMILASPR
ncbi:CK5P3 protein, partial [Polioptila caerulea]|nr:CK5P3 protein [Polioptila caerulea]